MELNNIAPDKFTLCSSAGKKSLRFLRGPKQCRISKY